MQTLDAGQNQKTGVSEANPQLKVIIQREVKHNAVGLVQFQREKSNKKGVKTQKCNQRKYHLAVMITGEQGQCV